MAYTPAAYRPTYESTSSDSPGSVARWMLGFLGVVAFASALVALVMFQISSEGAAKDSLRRATAALTEIDGLLTSHYEEMQVQAEASAPGDTIQLQDYPIAIGLTREDVLGVPQAELRAIILDRSADRLYEDGTAVLRESAEDQGSLGVFSVAGFTDRMLGRLTADKHTLFAVLSVVLFAIAAALLLATAASCQRWGKLAAAGLIIALAGAGTATGAMLAKVYTDSQSGDASEYLRGELFGLLGDQGALAVRNGIAFALAGAFIAAIAFAGSALSRRSTS